MPLSPPRDGLLLPPGLVMPGELGDDEPPVEPDVLPDVPELESLGEVLLEEPGAVVLLPEVPDSLGYVLEEPELPELPGYVLELPELLGEVADEPEEEPELP
ncbi:MAG TPA: hypothetical protein VJ652_00940 [Noviherbaspirillum sp.]|nr:hypothetical protein [Noviherbaspirillum sp.]